MSSKLYGHQIRSLASLAMMQDAGGIAMTVPQHYGKTKAMRQADLQKEAARALKVSRRDKKRHKLKGLRP